MIIAISGKSGSGKDTVGKLVAKELGIQVLSMTFKDLAKEKGISLMAFQELAASNSGIDRAFDSLLEKRAYEQKDCVVTTWLGPWVIKRAELRVFLDAPEAVRAKRVAGREGMEERQALAHLRERDGQNKQRYLKLYGIDIDDRKIFDMAIDTSDKTPEQIASLIVAKARKMKR